MSSKAAYTLYTLSIQKTGLSAAKPAKIAPSKATYTLFSSCIQKTGLSTVKPLNIAPSKAAYTLFSSSVQKTGLSAAKPPRIAPLKAAYTFLSLSNQRLARVPTKPKFSFQRRLLCSPPLVYPRVWESANPVQLHTLRVHFGVQGGVLTHCLDKIGNCADFPHV